MAAYMGKAFSSKRMVVIHGASDWERNIADVMEKASGDFQLKVVDRVVIDPMAADRYERIEQLVTLLQDDPELLVFLALYPEGALPVLQAVRDRDLPNRLVATDALANESFLDRLASLPMEKRIPGYYTNDMLLGMPLIYDTASRKAGVFRNIYENVYQQPPDWRAAFAYDAAGVLIQVMSRMVEGGQTLSSSKEGRKTLRQGLADMNTPESGYSGVTGLTVFDDSGDVRKPAAIGRYYQRNIISALSQLQSAWALPIDAKLKELSSNPRLAMIDDQLLEKTTVVYTGLLLESESDINTQEMTATLEGEVWFRYEPDTVKHGEFNPADIIFENAVSPVTLTPVGEPETANRYRYLRYRFNGKFQLDFIDGFKRYREPLLGVKFRHRSLPSGMLLYVVDMVGIGAGSGNYRKALSGIDHALQGDGWKIGLSAIYQNSEWLPNFGSPLYLGQPDGMVSFSSITAMIRLQSQIPSIIDILFPQRMQGSVLLVLITVLGVMGGVRFQRRKKSPATIGNLIIQLLLLVLTLLVCTSWTVNLLGEQLAFWQLDIISYFFQALLWLVPAHYLLLMIDVAFWQPFEQRSGRQVPIVLKRFVQAVIYLLAIFGVIAFVLGYPLTSLLATSGLLSLILGLAIQGNLANLISGLVLNADRASFKIGDIIQVDGGDPHRVQDINLRTTVLQHRFGYLKVVPNAKMANQTIINYSSQPEVPYYIFVPVSQHYAPDKVVAMLKKAANMVEHANLLPVEEADRAVAWSKPAYGSGNEFAAYRIVLTLREYWKKTAVRTLVLHKIREVFDEVGWKLPDESTIVLHQPKEESSLWGDATKIVKKKG